MPTVRMEPERLTISQGNSMELRCVTTGDPRPTITWTKVQYKTYWSSLLTLAFFSSLMV